MKRDLAYVPGWKAARAAVLERDEHTCQQCGETENLAVDHIFPFSQMTEDDIAAGLHLDPSNLRTLCKECNRAKGSNVITRVEYHNPKFFKKEK